jgi:hypothetical protein
MSSGVSTSISYHTQGRGQKKFKSHFFRFSEAATEIDEPIRDESIKTGAACNKPYVHIRNFSSRSPTIGPKSSHLGIGPKGDHHLLL